MNNIFHYATTLKPAKTQTSGPSKQMLRMN